MKKVYIVVCHDCGEGRDINQRAFLSEDDKVDAERFGFFADYEFMKARRTQPVQEEPRLKTLNCSSSYSGSCFILCIMQVSQD